MLNDRVRDHVQDQDQDQDQDRGQGQGQGREAGHAIVRDRDPHAQVWARESAHRHVIVVLPARLAGGQLTKCLN